MTATIHTIGSILEHGSRSDVVLSEDIISFAQAHGFDAGEDYSGHNPRFIYAEDEDRAEMLSDLSETAIDFLNELDLPPYTYYGNDGEAGAFGLWPFTTEFDPEDVLTVEEMPSLVAIVSDHGNVTLYTVELTEVWSVV